jgi:hypothetical protein
MCQAMTARPCVCLCDRAGCHGKVRREHAGRYVRAAGSAGRRRSDRLRELELLLGGQAAGRHGDPGLRASRPPLAARVSPRPALFALLLWLTRCSRLRMHRATLCAWRRR